MLFYPFFCQADFLFKYTPQREATDAYDGMPVVHILMHRGFLIDAIRNPDPNSVPGTFLQDQGVFC